MDSGRFDRILTIQHAVEEQDSTGQPARTWKDFITRWVEVRHLFGREIQFAQSLAANVDTEFLLRYDEDIKTVTPDETFRISYDDRLYDVKYSQEDTNKKGRRRSWRILARARTEGA